MSTSVNRQPIEFSSAPLPEACFVTGNHRSAISHPTCTTLVDRQPTERSSVPLPVACFQQRIVSQVTVSRRLADTFSSVNRQRTVCNFGSNYRMVFSWQKTWRSVVGQLPANR
ncbi:hypothetical protein MRB53_016515 [Persea americana]|uniref:Uncharacterized protein n=1 Tax=Persea americana TaxID=3435 RepID=A0ACC2M221_PERAE|nr:hypothetical protein MRB53_016515 [Persea americana]